MSDEKKISIGDALEFSANGVVCQGSVVRLEKADPLYCAVTVETDAKILRGAQLTLGTRTGVGGCGIAEPVEIRGKTKVALLIPYDLVNVGSI
jgi:hypothetical protein